jgi:hypothetical protein
MNKKQPLWEADRKKNKKINKIIGEKRSKFSVN